MVPVDRNDRKPLGNDELLENARQLRANAKAASRSLAMVVERLRETRAVASRLRAEMAAQRERQAADPDLGDPRAATLAPSNVTLLYVSQLAPGLSPVVVGRIASMSRVRNLQNGVTGLLGFDGSGFVQLLEGPARAVVELEQRLRRDRRHVDMEVLSYAPSRPGALRFPNWRLGFLSLEPDDVGIERMRGARGDDALALFDAALPRLDMDVSVALPA